MKRYLPILLLLLTACVNKDRPAEAVSADADTTTVCTETTPAQPVVAEKAQEQKKRAEKEQSAPVPQENAEVAPVEEQPVVPATPLTGVLEGHEWVDLGLSVKWATCNIGAVRPEDYGNYYAWGERKKKSSYTKDNSKTSGDKLKSIAAHRKRDAARAQWGSTWRIPTKAEMMELIEKCEVTWETRNGVNGKLVKNKATGVSIFLPAAGYRGSELYEAGESGRYWSATSEGTTEQADFLFFYSEHFNWHRDFRYYGLSIRPVTE